VFAAFAVIVVAAPLTLWWWMQISCSYIRLGLGAPARSLAPADMNCGNQVAICYYGTTKSDISAFTPHLAFTLHVAFVSDTSDTFHTSCPSFSSCGALPVLCVSQPDWNTFQLIQLSPQLCFFFQEGQI
jgi:hypothetical protein